MSNRLVRAGVLAPVLAISKTFQFRWEPAKRVSLLEQALVDSALSCPSNLREGRAFYFATNVAPRYCAEENAPILMDRKMQRLHRPVDQ